MLFGAAVTALYDGTAVLLINHRHRTIKFLSNDNISWVSVAVGAADSMDMDMRGTYICVCSGSGWRESFYFLFFFLVLSVIIEHCSYAWYANTFVIIGNCPSRATLSIGNIWPKWPQYIRKTTVQQLHVSFSAETEMKITHSHLPRSQKSIKTGYK